MNYREEYKNWCTDAYFDEDTKAELKALEGNEAEIEDRFYKKLEFGTGGLRGVIGAGTNRMNIYTVRQATQGLANYILSQNGQEKGVAIAHDSRIMSPEFAREAALCLNANGIKTYLFESLRPTPELSFAVRELGCIAGIVITASHNPREYNGYKVYWEDGAQITPPHDKNILAEVAKVTEYSQVHTMEEDSARVAGLFQIIGTDFDAKYNEQLKKQSIHPEIIKEAAKDMKIVYTPLHGTGNMSGMLIAEYILRERTKNGTMPENPALVETIVTTDMAKAIAADYNTALIEVLTGFKYIGEQIKFFEQTGAHNYVFGLEESYGCLAGTYARDKDACVAVMMLCEVASYYKTQGKTLWDAMVDMYEKYGYYKEGLATVTLKGIDGAQQIQEMMTQFRENPPKELAGHQVLAVRDYKADTRKDMATGEITETGLPASNVLYYELSENAWCCVRPSGTEPKIKFYFGVKGNSLEDAEEKLKALEEAMTAGRA